MYLSEIIEGKQQLTLVNNPFFAKNFDVIVCGLGTAGSLTALFLAQNELRVMGIEILSCAGGTHTAGGVVGHYFGCPGGRYETFEEKVTSFQAQHTVTSAESRKLLIEQELMSHNAQIIYEASVCGVYLEDNTVVGVKVLTDYGTESYSCKILMDCTADAYVAEMAGCITQYGRELDRQTQPYSIVSLLYDGKHYQYCNVDFGRVNQYNETDFSKAVIFSRAYKMNEAYTKKEFISQMPMIGIREGKRIIAEETVKIKDLFESRQTSTPMFYSYADLDKHGLDIAFDGEELGDWAIGANLGAYNVTVAVPYKSILPVKFDGILVPCRALGVDRDISSCVRMNLDMKKLAEVAAVWATFCIKQQKKLRDIPYSTIRNSLIQSGCLKESDNRGFYIDGAKDWDGSPLTPKEVCLIADPNKLENVLATEKPGIAIWSSKLMGEVSASVLLPLLESKNDNVRKHSAFAMAILGKSEGIPVLREMVTTRDGLMLKDSRKHNNFRGCMAIYWLGRLADREITKELIRLICDKKEIEKDVYHQKELLITRYEIKDFEGIYYQFVSQAVMALIRIGDAHKDLRHEIEAAFSIAFGDDKYYERFTKRPRESSEGNMVITLKKVACIAVEKWN